MSIVDLYASEARFKTAQNEYSNLMSSLRHSCLGKYKASAQCLRAAQLNADMQAELIKMSSLMVGVDPSTPGQPSVQSQQRKIIKLSKELSSEYALLMEDPAILKNAEIVSTMSHSNFVLWAIVAGLLSLIVVV